MFRLIKVIFFLAFLGFVGLSGYAVFGLKAPQVQESRVPVTLNVD